MHSISTFSEVGPSGFGSKKPGGSVRVSPKGDDSILRNKLAKGLKDRFRSTVILQQNTEIEEDKSDEDAKTELDHLENLSVQCPSEGMDTNYDMIGLAQDGNKYQAGVKVALTRYSD